VKHFRKRLKVAFEGEQGIDEGPSLVLCVIRGAVLLLAVFSSAAAMVLCCCVEGVTQPNTEKIERERERSLMPCFCWLCSAALLRCDVLDVM
jgi:hypothetical protein